jgi:hypothetical protein
MVCGVVACRYDTDMGGWIFGQVKEQERNREGKTCCTMFGSNVVIAVFFTLIDVSHRAVGGLYVWISEHKKHGHGNFEHP